MRKNDIYSMAKHMYSQSVEELVPPGVRYSQVLMYRAGLTVRTLLSTSLQQQFGDGYVVGHDGDVEWRQASTVKCVQIQVLG